MIITNNDKEQDPKELIVTTNDGEKDTDSQNPKFAINKLTYNEPKRGPCDVPLEILSTFVPIAVNKNGPKNRQPTN